MKKVLFTVMVLIKAATAQAGVPGSPVLGLPGLPPVQDCHGLVQPMGLPGDILPGLPEGEPVLCPPQLKGKPQILGVPGSPVLEGEPVIAPVRLVLTCEKNYSDSSVSLTLADHGGLIMANLTETDSLGRIHVSNYVVEDGGLQETHPALQKYTGQNFDLTVEMATYNNGEDMHESVLKVNRDGDVQEIDLLCQF